MLDSQDSPKAVLRSRTRLRRSIYSKSVLDLVQRSGIDSAHGGLSSSIKPSGNSREGTYASDRGDTGHCEREVAESDSRDGSEAIAAETELRWVGGGGVEVESRGEKVMMFESRGEAFRARKRRP